VNNASPPARWRTVVGALALSGIVSWGVLYYAFGALVPAMQAELGWSQGFLGGAFSLALFVAALCAVPVGRWLERRGPRGLMTLGACAGAALVFGWSEVEGRLAFYALFLALGFPLASVLYEAAFGALVLFLGAGRRTDLSLLFLTFVAGFASTVFVPLTQALEAAYGWRGALRILAVLLAVVTIPLHAFALPKGAPAMSVVREPSTATTGAAATSDLPRAPLALCAAAFAFATVAGTSLGIFQVPILMEQGFDAAFVAKAAVLFGVGQALGRLAFTWLRPRYALTTWSVVLFLPCAVGLALLALAPGPRFTLAAILLFALASGGQTLGRAAWALELFPPASFARANGVLGLWSLLGRAGAPLALGAAHDLAGSHAPGLATLAGLCLVGGTCAWVAVRDPRR
jgi:MFS family permease